MADARETVGADADLMVNAVMSYNVEFAVRLAERLRQYDLRWLEEPLTPPDLEGHIALKRAVPWMPIATGEDHHGRHAFRQLVEHRCADVLQPDLKWCGGLSEALKIYTIAEAAGLITVPARRGQYPVRTALRHGHARVAHGGSLAWNRPRNPARGGAADPRHVDAGRRLRNAAGRAGIRFGNRRGVARTVGSRRRWPSRCAVRI